MRSSTQRGFDWLFVLGFLCLVVIGCEPNTFSPLESESFSHDKLTENQMRELILGKWDWVYGIIMSRNLPPPSNRITPQSLGYTMQREFMRNGQVKFYKSGQHTETHLYEIRRFKVLPMDASPTSVIYINGNSWQLHFSHPDTVMIGNGWADGTDYYYARMK